MHRVIKQTFKVFFSEKGLRYSFFRSLIGFCSGGLTVILVSQHLTKVEQGFFYTFYSVLGVRMLFELGLNQVVLHLASKEIAISENTEDSLGLSAIRPLMRFTVVWYGIASLLYISFLLVAGFWIFQNEPLIETVNWKPAWVLMCLSGGISLLISPIISVLSGMQLLDEAAYISFISHFFMQLGVCVCLFAGFGLWSSSISLCIGVLVQIVLQAKYINAILEVYSNAVPERKFSWINDAFKFQAKIAIAWGGAYLSVTALTPIIFAKCGAVAAGLFGLSLTLCNSLRALAQIWFQFKVPVLSKFLTEGRLLEFKILLRERITGSLLVGLFAYLMMIVGAQSLAVFEVQVSERLLDVSNLCFLSAFSILVLICSLITGYLRLYNDEPLFRISLINGLVVFLFVAYFSGNWNLASIIKGIFFIQVLFTCISLIMIKPAVQKIRAAQKYEKYS